MLLLQAPVDAKPQAPAQLPSKTSSDAVSSKPEKTNYAREHSDSGSLLAPQEQPAENLPPKIESKPRDPAPFVPPPETVSRAKEAYPVRSPTDDLKSAPPKDPAPSQQRSEKSIVVPQSNAPIMNMKDFMPVSINVLLINVVLKCCFFMLRSNFHFQCSQSILHRTTPRLQRVSNASPRIARAI